MGKFKIIACTTVVGLFLLAFNGDLLAAGPITLDGRFKDWEGQACMNDPAKDATSGNDILKFYWANNEGESNLYFMIERASGSSFYYMLSVSYRLFLDINDDGAYNGATDAYVDIFYSPYFSGLVIAYTYRSDGTLLGSTTGYWGDTVARGGRKCEFSVSMEKLGIYPAQPIRMYITSNGDRVPDSGDIQWSPIPIMPLWALISIFVMAVLTGTYFIRKRMKT